MPISTTGSAARRSTFVAITIIKSGAMRAAVTGPSLNERAARIIAQELGAAVHAAGKRLAALVLDMSSVTQISSIGLGMCIDVRNAAHAAGAPTFVVGLSRELADLFRAMRVDRLMTVVSGEEELKRLLQPIT